MTVTPVPTDEAVLNRPIAVVRGQPFVQIPADLYIPPQALEVLLESFTGPLDLLLYLIKKQNFDILAIPVAEVTRQYMQYIELMQVLEIELAAEYLVMAALLAEIKSRGLLPRPAGAAIPDEADPRVELIRRLQEYEQIKQAAQTLDQLPRQERDLFLAMVPVDREALALSHTIAPTLDLSSLLAALQAVLQRAALRTHHAITPEPLSIRERMTQILQKLSTARQVAFTTLFQVHEGKMGVVVTFIALLELSRQSALELWQETPFSEITVSIK
jgi:segregation and condensation protein A